MKTKYVCVKCNHVGYPIKDDILLKLVGSFVTGAIVGFSIARLLVAI